MVEQQCSIRLTGEDLLKQTQHGSSTSPRETPHVDRNGTRQLFQEHVFNSCQNYTSRLS